MIHQLNTINNQLFGDYFIESQEENKNDHLAWNNLVYHFASIALDRKQSDCFRIIILYGTGNHRNHVNSVCHVGDCMEFETGIDHVIKKQCCCLHKNTIHEDAKQNRGLFQLVLIFYNQCVIFNFFNEFQRCFLLFLLQQIFLDL